MMESFSKTYLTADEIVRIIEKENISIVSFDIFDTLLVRPSMIPSDIFFLLQEREKERYGIDLVNLRIPAEEQLGKQNATLEEIWSFIAKKNKISLNIAESLMRDEIDLELTLLEARKDVKYIYDKAVELGKRIIVVSDMYWPSAILEKALRDNGYTEIGEIYVSCEYSCRKDTGELFDIVIREEGIDKPSKLLHIGDNYRSDFRIPIEKGITALYYPSIWDYMLAEDTCYGMFFNKKRVSEDPFMRILISFSLAYMYDSQFDKLKFFGGSLKGFSYIFLAPLLVSIACDIGTNERIQDKYAVLNFAARDGFLPKAVYDILFSNSAAIPSRYIYVSRQALSYVSYDDFFKYFDDVKIGDETYLLEEFIKCSVVDGKTKDKILATLLPEEKKLDMHSNQIGCRRVLLRYKEQLNATFAQQRAYAMQYYSSQIDRTNQRELVFDIGYSGSVSRGLISALNGKTKIDKYYLWQTEENRRTDKVNGTETFCFFETPCPVGLNIVLEECFSPVEGSCLGFEQKGAGVVPYLDKIDADIHMKADMEEVYNSTLEYAERFKKRFGEYARSFSISDRTLFENLGFQGLLFSEYMELKLFKSIKFRDSNIAGIPISLSSKVFKIFQREKLYTQPFYGTEFRNPEVQLCRTECKTTTNSKIGIHIHLYNVYLYEEIARRLENFPFEFDLIITVVSEESADIIRNVYTKDILEQMQKLYIKVVENRGRDIAPWLIATREFQEEYDYFCHLHAKASTQYDGKLGDRWRNYLFANLIDGSSARTIISAFDRDERLGCVFPQFFAEVAEICITNDISLMGVDGEEEIVDKLMKALGITKTFDREDMLWSAGTMLWYRPAALKPLFELGLTIEDFPEEPIGVGGTIAHAIERIVTAVSKYQGYSCKIYNVDATESKLTRAASADVRFSAEHVIGVRGALKNWLYKKLDFSTASLLCRVFKL